MSISTIQHPTPLTPDQTGMRYEYAVWDERSARGGFEEWLNARAAEGFRLVSMTQSYTGSGSKTRAVMERVVMTPLDEGVTSLAAASGDGQGR